MATAKPGNIDEYIAGFPAETQRALTQIRETIKELAPEAEEAISYAIPTFKLRGHNLVHFAAFANHIGFYPTPVGMEAFENAFAAYKTGKGSVQFPLDKPIPLDLITKIVLFLIKGNSEKPAKKISKKQS
ncbi:iron chaperone [Adhaeribacter terreus]|uniref:Iron chaperone n=1 Tax=Adhaeribacter terreus TaxID=529703 RepID=A0ABW0E8W9_9BACT